MRILLVHNRYLYPGGEDSVVDMEFRLLKAKGHSVFLFEKKNEEIGELNIRKKFNLFINTIWSNSTYYRISSKIDRLKPDVIHVHNFFPLHSPSVFYAAKNRKIPVVYTLHNYRIICANGLFLRNETPCLKCLYFGLHNSLKYNCYRNSKLQTVPVFLMNLAHKKFKTWTNLVDRYIVLSKFSKDIFKQYGIPSNKVVIKPHFIYPSPKSNHVSPENYALFIGQLSEKKGVRFLLEAWRSIENLELILLGNGPSDNTLRKYTIEHKIRNVRFMGQVELDTVFYYLKRAKFLILPSIHHEGFPRVIVEAFAFGKPVIVSNTAPLDEFVDDGITGFLIESTNAKDLKTKVEALNSNNERLKKFSFNARKEFEKYYTAKTNYDQLIKIYHEVIDYKHREV